RARPRHGANRGRLPNRPRHLPVCAGGSVRNTAKLFPHAALKRGGLYIGGQIEVWLAAAQMLEDLSHPSLKTVTVAPYLRARAFLLQRHLQPRIRVAKIERADAAIRSPYKEPPERRIHDCVVDAHSRAALPVGGRRHAQMRRRSLIQPAARAKSRVVQCSGHVVSFSQLSFEPAHAL